VAATGTIAIDKIEERRAGEPTAASVWRALSGASITDELLAWPPDLFALANVILTDTEAFRFALSPIGEWPPGRHADWAHVVVDAGHRWAVWVEDRHGEPPDLLTDEWNVFRERADTPLAQLASGHEPSMCEALLTLHAIADEACAGLAVALDSSNADGGLYRARGRELLGRTGSLARLNPRVLRVLPKVCSPPTGRPSFSRYACVRGPGAEARWHKMPARHRGTDIRSEYATLLLLPWPLRVQESDFHALADSVQRLEKDPFGFFEFAPSEGLDLDLLDRVLVAARKEANSVDVVVLPESAIDESEIDELEALLHRHGVVYLQAGVRQRAARPGRLPANYMHTGVNPRLEKGGTTAGDAGAAWFHIRQNKHHRWSLDEGQIYQYRLGGVLHPRIRWWEAMEVPRRVVEFVEVAELTLVSLVCEDLAQNDDIASLIRSVGPTVVVTVLLDGPQLTSRWSARYASVLADDPGSAVLTLTSFGMVQRSRPHGHDASRVIALWKGPAGGVREIPLESGAQAVLLTVCMDRATRRCADGRWPVDNGTYCFDVGVEQIRASELGTRSPSPRPPASTAHVLEAQDLTVLTAWAEAVAEAMAYAPARIPALLEAARAGAPWRRAFGLPEPCRQLDEAIDSIERALGLGAGPSSDPPTFDAALASAREDRPGETDLDTLARRVLLSMLEQRRTRQPSAGQ
jgi:hypothetical protein